MKPRKNGCGRTANTKYSAEGSDTATRQWRRLITNSRLKHIRQDPQRRPITENSWKSTQAQKKRERQGKEMASFDITKILNKQTTARTENGVTEDFKRYWF